MGVLHAPRWSPHGNSEPRLPPTAVFHPCQAAGSMTIRVRPLNISHCVGGWRQGPSGRTHWAALTWRDGRHNNAQVFLAAAAWWPVRSRGLCGIPPSSPPAAAVAAYILPLLKEHAVSTRYPEGYQLLFMPRVPAQDDGVSREEHLLKDGGSRPFCRSTRSA